MMEEGNRMRILLAEDDHHVSIIMQICLEKLGGHSVVVREDGESALNEALNTSYDLVLLDGMMPKKSGLQVARELRDSGYGGPIIFLSAKSDERDVADFLSLATGYIAKPFDPQTICARIDEILARRGEAAG